MSVVLITGCSSGIGLETAVAFARRGDTTYASMREPRTLGHASPSVPRRTASPCTSSASTSPTTRR